VIWSRDRYDPRLTLTFLKKFSLSPKPKAFKIAALLDKPSRRKLPIEGDYVALKIPDEFVVGYGLDYWDALIAVAQVGADPNAPFSATHSENTLCETLVGAALPRDQHYLVIIGIGIQIARRSITTRSMHERSCNSCGSNAREAISSSCTLRRQLVQRRRCQPHRPSPAPLGARRLIHSPTGRTQTCRSFHSPRLG